MRILSLASFFTLGLFYAGFSQVDVLTARADPKTFIFDDDKHTVHGYIYAQLKEKSSCCGNDAVYLEVKFDESGKVTSAKTLTGKNDCYKQSVVDIVSSVRWNAVDVKGSKTIYFEVKPIVPCSGSPNENVYKKIPLVGGGEIAAAPKKEEASKEVAVAEPVKKEPEPVKQPVKTEPVVVSEPVKKEPETKPVVVAQPVKKEAEPTPVAVKEEPVAKEEPAEEDGFLSEEKDEPVAEEPAKKADQPVVYQPAPNNKLVVTSRNDTPSPTVESSPKAVSKAPQKPGGGKIPPQANIEYVSTGEHNPDPSHKGSFANVPMGGVGNPEISDQSQFGVEMRKNLRNIGYCGLAQALIEVELDRNGSVVNSRVMYANDAKVKEILPNIVRTMKFKSPAGNPKTIFSYYEVKTEIVCEGNKPKYELEKVPDILKASAQ
jgi:hypothetical protein